ncbi:hypothetical protein An12g03590 [Aspergillus niger]|uniref:Uncharacterized protein n=2 Tax=Aspergillus niger TaxID=5061 RepID=A2QZ45_ASPNC|nr:hypothetical protein An12g03590 [Aspergillus niger]CAK46130.1 hypothetical protein An12g03590 [Aspergillus niger]
MGDIYLWCSQLESAMTRRRAIDGAQERPDADPEHPWRIPEDPTPTALPFNIRRISQTRKEHCSKQDEWNRNI